MGKRDGHRCCECDFCSAGPCDHAHAIYVLFLTDSPGHEYVLFCRAHAPRIVAQTRAYLAAHPGVAVDPECADAWAVAEAVGG